MLRFLLHVWLLSLGVLSAQTATQDADFATYDTALRKLDAARVGQEQTVRVHYFKLLDDFIEASELAGTSEYVIWAESEKVRFDENPIIVVNPELAVPDSIKDGQTRLRRTLEVAESKWRQAYVQLTDDYVVLLERERVRLSAEEENAEQSRVLRDRIREIMEAEEYQQALLHVKAMQAGQVVGVPGVESDVLFEEGFDHALGVQWIANHEDVVVKDGLLIASSHAAKVRLNRAFVGDFCVEVDVVKVGDEDLPDWDFGVALEAPDLQAEIAVEGQQVIGLRLRGVTSLSNSDRAITLPGTLSVTCRDGRAQSVFLSAASGRTLATEWVVATFEQTRLVFELGGRDTENLLGVDAVRVRSVPEKEE
ncbi:MAG: hypothetical protein ACI97B_002057 [Verrucomicrobiales bacterium]|jgi:hypothetical protein